MVVRRLTKDEWSRLDPVFLAQFNEMPPDRRVAAVYIAEEKGDIKGMLCLQMILHAEPLWVKPGTNWAVRPLIKALERDFPDMDYCFAHIKEDRVASFAERLGMKLMPWKIYRWLRKEQTGG